MHPKNKVSASTLILTIVIALILAILSVSVIMLAYYSGQRQITANVGQRLMRNLESATNLVLSSTEPLSSSQTDTIDLFEEGHDSVIIKKELWGIYEMTAITAFSNRFSRKKSFISGSSLPGYMDGCLYLADHRRPLSVNGKTSLTGDVYLSKAGIRPTYIDQGGYSGDKLVEGNIKMSKENLPVLSNAVVNYLYRLLKPDSMSSVPAVPLPDDSLIQSFYDSVAFFYSKREIQLNDLTLKGHIIIKSDSIIEVGASVITEDVILMAPVIKFAKGFKGVLQAIATDSLIVESDCSFDYPSALVLFKKRDAKMQNILRMGENCQFKGIIMARCENEDLFKCYVEINKNTQIDGVVYVMGYCTLGAQVNGTVLSDYFLYKTQNIMYENTLVNVVLNRRLLSEYFIGSSIFENAPQKQIIKWVK